MTTSLKIAMSRKAPKALIAALALLAWHSSAFAFEVAGTGQVTKVADGDTFTVSAESTGSWEALRSHAAAKQENSGRDLDVGQRFGADNQSFVIRVGNIDTAESVHPDQSRNSKAGKVASNYARDLLLGERVSFRCWDIGYYGRAICSVWNDQWEFGSHMIARGLSHYVTDYGEHPFWHDGYQKAERSAQGQMR